MAIGTSITPRGYDIDETGKAYTLDPKPLLDAQSRTFQLQRESMNTVYETGRKGVAFAEYLGARQQLGRMKAELSDLDPKDPLFYRKYSEIIGNNPLAFTHEKTSPIAKMALAPVVTEATRIRSHKDEMEKVRAQAINRANELGIRYRNQSSLQDDRQGFQQDQQGRSFEFQEDQQGRRIDAQGNFLETRLEAQERMNRERIEGRRSGSGGGDGMGFLFGRPPITDTPAASKETTAPTTVPPGVTSPDAGNYPTRTREMSNPSNPLLPPLPVEDRLLDPDFVGPPSPFGQVISGQGDADDAPEPAAAPTPDLAWKGASDRTVSGYDVTESPVVASAPAPAAPAAAPVPPEVAAAAIKAEPVKDQVPAPKKYPVGTQHPDYGWMATNAGWMRITKVGNDVQFEPVVVSQKPDAPKGYLALPEVFNEDRSVAKWKLEKEVERSAAEIKELDDNIKTRLAADPEIGQFSAAVIGKKAELASLEAQRKFHETEHDKTELEKVLPQIEKLSKELERADAAGRIMTERKKHQILNLLDPKYAAQSYALAEDTRAEQMREESLQGPPRPEPAEVPDITDTPAPAPPKEEPPAHELLRQQDPGQKEKDKAWTEEKMTVVKEARDLAVKLGLPENAVIQAVETGNKKSLDSIVSIAYDRGIKSPLIGVQGSSAYEGAIGTPVGGWGWSKKVKENYLDVLRRAIEDPHIKKVMKMDSTKGASGEGWTLTPKKSPPQPPPSP